MNQKVLILSASVGAGHLRAAEAVELAAREIAPGAVVKNVDVLGLTTRAFRKVYGEAYLDLVNKAPHFLGYFYDVMDRAPSRRRKSDRLRLAVERLNVRPLVKFLTGEGWDKIVCTHFLPAEIIAMLRRKGRMGTPQMIATTDFEVHRLWVNQPCEHYFTATGEGKARLISWGVPERDISVSGIPIHPVFSVEKDRAACRARHGLRGDRAVVLLLAGGFGVGPVERIFEAIGKIEIEMELEIVVVCGRNEGLKKRIEAAVHESGGLRDRAKVMGFTDRMDELMTAADVVVSKPGGLTSSEALASGAAMAIVNPIPGQESRNSDYLLEHGAGIKINSVATLGYKLGDLLGDRARLARIRKNARSLGRARAAFEVARAALDWPTSCVTEDRARA